MLMMRCLVYHRVVESKNSSFQIGDYIVGNFGWRTLTISNGKQVTNKLDRKLDRKLYTDKKLSTAVGILGMPGYALFYIVFSYT